jgi:hypothetical protein
MAEPVRPFVPGDFLVFEPHKQRDALYNEARRRVRAKLGALGKFAAKEVAARTGVRFDTKTSLNHPYSYNAYKVDAQWFTLYRPKSERGPLQAILGSEFKDDLDPSYQHVQSPQRERLSEALKPLAGYLLRIHDFQKHYRCEEMTPGMLATFAQYMKPGEHRFTLWRDWPDTAPELAGEGCPAFVVEELSRLVPAYRSIAWSPENNLVFAARPPAGGT